MNRFPRGAHPTSRAELAAARPHVRSAATPPSSFLWWPIQMCGWGNIGNGCCVTSEECFAKAVMAPQVFIPNAKAIQWASNHGFLNGAFLPEVMECMARYGIQKGGVTYEDGPYSAVDWRDQAALADAISQNGPVKLGVASGNFESNPDGSIPGFTSGWTMWNYPAALPEDHCVSLCGYGTLAELATLFVSHGVTVSPVRGMPTGLCYAIFTWSSIGIVDAQSFLNFTAEAWVRNPVTVVKEGEPAAPPLASFHRT
jgi:hypothetical protein